MAAVELLAATRDLVYDEAFQQSSELDGKDAIYLDQLGADFSYARLPAHGRLFDLLAVSVENTGVRV